MSSEDDQNIKQQKNGKFKATVGSETKTFDSFDEANAWVQEQENDSDDRTTSTNDPSNIDEKGIQEANATAAEVPHEKPASEMSEADAVAINADVRVPGAATSDQRIVTEGEKDQVAAGLHPDPAEGNPNQEEESDSENGEVKPAVDTKAADNVKAD